ncbi:MAG: NINE protein [Thermoguttaceae bacterium]
METDNGKRGKAGQVKGLIPAKEPSPFETETTGAPQTDSTTSRTATPGEAYCTNCGTPVYLQAIACMKCGADPRVHKNYCRNCGVGLNPNQVVCIKCGSSVEVKKKSSSSGGLGEGEKNKVLAAIFAFFLGSFGIHKFYLGDQKWGIIYLVLTLSSLLLIVPVFVVAIMALVDGIKLLMMSDEDFQKKYCSG